MEAPWDRRLRVLAEQESAKQRKSTADAKAADADAQLKATMHWYQRLLQQAIASRQGTGDN